MKVPIVESYLVVVFVYFTLEVMYSTRMDTEVDVQSIIILERPRIESSNEYYKTTETRGILAVALDIPFRCSTRMRRLGPFRTRRFKTHYTIGFISETQLYHILTTTHTTLYTLHLASISLTQITARAVKIFVPIMDSSNMQATKMCI